MMDQVRQVLDAPEAMPNIGTAVLFVSGK